VDLSSERPGPGTSVKTAPLRKRAFQELGRGKDARQFWGKVDYQKSKGCPSNKKCLGDKKPLRKRGLRGGRVLKYRTPCHAGNISGRGQNFEEASKARELATRETLGQGGEIMRKGPLMGEHAVADENPC